MSTIGDLVRERRRAHGLTQERLARRAGTTQAAISRLERGRVSPSLDTVEDLLRVLGETSTLEARRIEHEGHDARLAAMHARPPEERMLLAFSWNRFAGEVAAAGARARDRS